MRFSEYLFTYTSFWDNTMLNFPHLKSFLQSNFANFAMLYDYETFTNKLQGMLLNNILELKLCETSVEQWFNTPFTPDKFGTSGDTISNATGNNTNAGAMSYGGYNADGDYQKNNSTANQTSNATTKTNNLNYFEFFRDINNAKYYKTWKDFETQFCKLFQRYYL